MPLPGFWKFAQHSPLSQSLHPLPVYNLHLSSCCSGGQSQSGYVCPHSNLCGPFKLNLLKNPAFSFTASTFPFVFYTQKLLGFIVPVLEPGLCGLAWGWDHPLLRYPSQFLFTICECGIVCSGTTASLCHAASPYLSAHLCESAPPTYLNECHFVKFLVVGLPYSLIFLQFWALFVLRSSCNSLYGYTGKQSVSTYAPTLTRSPFPQF